MIIFTLPQAEKVTSNNYCNTQSVFLRDWTKTRDTSFLVQISSPLQAARQSKQKAKTISLRLSLLRLVSLENLRKSLSDETCAKVLTKKAPCSTVRNRLN